MARRRNGKVRDSIFGVTAVDSQLIYDVGAHRGEDTDFYPAKGFRVVAVEANPLLSGKLREKFRSQLDDGTLALWTRRLLKPWVKWTFTSISICPIGARSSLCSPKEMRIWAVL